MRTSCFLAILLVALSLDLLSPSAGRSQPATTVQVNTVDASAYPAIKATVTVLDGTQRPVLNLPREAFQVSSQGQALPISDVASATDTGLGIGVVLTFDTSGSMQGAPLAAAKEAGKALLGQLGPGDQAAVLAFSDSVRGVQGFTQDRQALAGAIDSLAAGGNTALYNAVVQSTQEAQSASLPRRAVVLLTDGADFGGVSGVDSAGSLSAAGASGIPFFAVGLGSAVDQPYLQQLADTTRGQLAVAPAPESLTGLYQNIGNILRHQYVLTFDASALGQAGTVPLRVTVNSSGASASGDAQLQLPGVPVTAAPTASPAPASAAPPGTQGKGGGAGSLLVVLAVAVSIAVAGAAAAVFFWRRRGDKREAEVDMQRIREQPASPFNPAIPTAAQATPAKAYLQLEPTDGGSTYPLGDWPVTVGFTSDCTICLPDGDTGRWERVRIWRREGRYMLHNLSRIGGVFVAGKAATWAILEDGDEVRIGSQRLIFREPDSQQP